MTVVSKTLIVNKGLIAIGEPPISDIADANSKPARHANLVFDTERDAVLAETLWKFAVKRTSVTEDATAPAYGYANRYLLPSDYIRMVDIENKDHYIIEGNYILGNHGSSLNFRYIYRLTDVTQYDPNFINALGLKIASSIAQSIIQSQTLADKATKLYEAEIRKAATVSAQNSPPEQNNENHQSDWIDSRIVGTRDATGFYRKS